MAVRTFVSFEADDAAFPPDVEDAPPGRELAKFVSDALRRAGPDHEGPEELEGWAWDMHAQESDVSVACVVGLTDDPPMQWQIHTYGRIPRLRRWLTSHAVNQQEEVLARWCEAIDAALKADGRFRSIRWYAPVEFERDHRKTWAETPT